MVGARGARPSCVGFTLLLKFQDLLLISPEEICELVFDISDGLNVSEKSEASFRQDGNVLGQ